LIDSSAAAGKPCLTATETGPRLISVNATVGFTQQGLSTIKNLPDRNKIPWSVP
jgi:hypothetical protein